MAADPLAALADRTYLDGWLSDRAYYRLGLTDPRHRQSRPAHRRGYPRFVAQHPDARARADALGGHAGQLLWVLWGLSGPVTVFGVTIPGYMVWVALAYAVVGTWLTHLVGRPLVGLNFRQQRVEADFRFALVRLRENVEGVALYRGEADEKRGLLDRFAAVIGTGGRSWRTKRLTAFTAGYDQVAVVFPFVVAAPRYFRGEITLGDLTQTAERLRRGTGRAVLVRHSIRPGPSGAPRWSGWRASTGADAARSAGAGDGVPCRRRRGGAVEDVTLALPDGRKLLDGRRRVSRAGRVGGGHRRVRQRQVHLVPRAGRHLAVRQGTGASAGRGAFAVPAAAALSAARHAAPRRLLSRATRRRTMRRFARRSRCGPRPPVDRLDEEDPWAQRLSGGEQQRVALARALLAKPDWLFLDEATASLDPEAEAHFYALLRERLPDATLVSIAHRPSVARYHDRTLRLRDGRLVEAAAG